MEVSPALTGHEGLPALADIMEMFAKLKGLGFKVRLNIWPTCNHNRRCFKSRCVCIFKANLIDWDIAKTTELLENDWVDGFSYVNVPQRDARKVIEVLNHATIRGRRIRANLATPATRKS